MRPLRAAAAATTVLLAIALVAGCGGSSGEASGASGDDHAGHGATAFEGGTISPVRAAPPLRLRDIDGKVVDIADMRGDPVLVTFVYANCPDVCPLIMANLRAARKDAGALGRRTRVIAVSVDPKGDTPAVVRRFLSQRGVAGFVDYLIGTRAQLEPVWAAWHVAHQVPKDDPELVEAGPWFQWHHDRWTPPPGARSVARTALAPQAFTIGRSLAVQFHPELTVDQLAGWLGNGGADYLVAHGAALAVSCSRPA